VLVPLPPAVARAIDRAVGTRTAGPILLNTPVRHEWTGTPLPGGNVGSAGVRLPRMHPHMLRHTFVTTMLDAGVDLCDVQIAARHIHGLGNLTTTDTAVSDRAVSRAR
jgi:integrase/recombinase XerD